jgi:hypothetical protein
MAADPNFKNRFKKMANKSEGKTPGEKYADEETEDTEAKQTAPRKEAKVDPRWAMKGKGKWKKSDDEMDCEKADDGDDDELPEDEEDGGMEKTKKSEGDAIPEEMLQKSLKALSKYISSNDAATRRQELLTKAQTGELRKSERAELMDMLGGRADNEPRLADDLTKSMRDNEGVQKAVDVSEYLRSNHEEMCKSLEHVGDAIQGMDDRQAEFNMLTAQALHYSGALIKSMAERLGAIEQTPARRPKSAGVPGGQALEKSFAGQQHQPNQLSKAEVLNALTILNEQSYADGRNGLSKSNCDIGIEASKYEQTSAINPLMLQEVQAFCSQRRSN